LILNILYSNTSLKVLLFSIIFGKKEKSFDFPLYKSNIMASIDFKQGEDKLVSVQVIKSPAVDLTTAINIKAVLKNGTTVLKSYSLLPESGYGTLEVDGLLTNQVNIAVERADSQNFPVGPLKVVLLVEYIDVLFPDGGRTEEYTYIVGNIRTGEAKNEPMP